ncbi:hypothetical protein IFR04_003142 [Cadophora malorum]|uniref:Uncharacterized protein n=1 Tax=Cadophora malorum TaxID=108018 RepID=A0A8H7WFA0_9HELO|nr:hypothetical protein IFR04_003142 [Cadophora malorum]
MIEIASIIIAIIALVGTLVSASITGWLAIYSDEHKLRLESEKMMAKYRDPLLLAAQDLQSRLYNILDNGFLTYVHGPKELKDLLFLHTSYLVGQYFSWNYILRRRTQFLCYHIEEDNKEVTEILEKINGVFSTISYRDRGWPFMLWRGQQQGIGEIMTINDNGELLCMGYAAFVLKWTEDEKFRKWFDTIHTSIDDLGKAGDQNDINHSYWRCVEGLVTDPDAVTLAKELDGFPLALATAGAYLD